MLIFATISLQSTLKCLIVKPERRTASPKGQKIRRHRMYILQVRFRRSWKWGINTYETLEAAEARVAELEAVGIKARIRQASELYGAR